MESATRPYLEVLPDHQDYLIRGGSYDSDPLADKEEGLGVFNQLQGEYAMRREGLNVPSAEWQWREARMERLIASERDYIENDPEHPRPALTTYDVFEAPDRDERMDEIRHKLDILNNYVAEPPVRPSPAPASPTLKERLSARRPDTEATNVVQLWGPEAGNEPYGEGGRLIQFPSEQRRAAIAAEELAAAEAVAAQQAEALLVAQTRARAAVEAALPARHAAPVQVTQGSSVRASLQRPMPLLPGELPKLTEEEQDDKFESFADFGDNVLDLRNPANYIPAPEKFWRFISGKKRFDAKREKEKEQERIAFEEATAGRPKAELAPPLIADPTPRQEASIQEVPARRHRGGFWARRTQDRRNRQIEAWGQRITERQRHRSAAGTSGQTPPPAHEEFVERPRRYATQ